MKFEWDEGKNQSNIEKHGVSFEDAIRVLMDLQSILLMNVMHMKS